MNERDEELARSIDPDAWRKIHKDDADWCQQFADLIRADEREAIIQMIPGGFSVDPQWVCDAIRARGQA